MILLIRMWVTECGFLFSSSTVLRGPVKEFFKGKVIRDQNVYQGDNIPLVLIPYIFYQLNEIYCVVHTIITVLLNGRFSNSVTNSLKNNSMHDSTS
jgi:hypothetical protein